MLHIYESFLNAKSIKLFGWETKFLNSIETTYKEESAISDKALLRNKMRHYRRVLRAIHVIRGLFGLYRDGQHAHTKSNGSLQYYARAYSKQNSIASLPVPEILQHHGEHGKNVAILLRPGVSKRSC